MSYVIRCDRCGQLARTQAPYGEAPETWLMMAQVRTAHAARSDDRGYHLCPECVASFDDWLADGTSETGTGTKR